MNNKSPGRKPKYTYETLLESLRKYLSKNPNTKINVSELARVTNIPRHIWRDNNKINKVIDEINNPPVMVNPEKLEFVLPNSVQLVESNYNNKPKLIKAIQDCFDVMYDLYEGALKGLKVEEREKKFKMQITELQACVKEKDQEIQRLNHEIDLLYLESESPTKRKDMGLKSNLIKLTSENEKAISKKISDLKDEYKGLFD